MSRGSHFFAKGGPTVCIDTVGFCPCCLEPVPPHRTWCEDCRGHRLHVQKNGKPKRRDLVREAREIDWTVP